MSSDSVYTWEEVAKHKSKQDGVWVVVHNEVYDVTKFLDDHPGGEEVILEQAGGDATEAFDDIGHSPDAKNLQKNFRIGKISEPKGFVPRSTDDTTPKPEEPKGFSYDVILKVAILIVLGLIAYSIISPYLLSK